MTDDRYWQYIESELYKIFLNNGSIIRINLSIDDRSPLDIVEIRFYHPCNQNKDLINGEIYPYVDGTPAIPTIGKVITPKPIYISAPNCPEYGTVITMIWDTDDTKHSGNITYEFLFKGLEPIYIKTIELYIARK